MLNHKNNLLWYVARADLSRSGDAEVLHSREDVRGLRRAGWNSVLYASAYSMDAHVDDSHEVIVTRKKGVLGRILFEFFMIKRLLHRSHRPAFVFFRGPTNLLFLGVFLLWRGIPFGVELNGVWAYRVQSVRLIRHLFEWAVDNFFLKHSTVIVGVTEELSAIAKKNCRPSSVVVTARNGVAFDKITPVRAKDTQFDIKIGFLGKAYIARGLDDALLMIKELKKRGVNASFLAVGGGPEVNRLKNLANRIDIGDVVDFINAVEPEEMATIVSDCQVMWAGYDDQLTLKLSGLSPLKIWTYLSIGKPAFVRELDVLRWYRDVPGILWTKAKTPEALADDLIHYLELYGKAGLISLGSLGRRYVEENVSWDHHTRIISEAIERAISRPPVQ